MEKKALIWEGLTLFSNYIGSVFVKSDLKGPTVFKLFRMRLDSRFLRFLRFQFAAFSFFFFFTRFLPLAATVHVRYMNSSRNIWPVFREQYIRVLFTDPQILFFINFFIKNGSHGTIYTFKNYFATVISAISFQFQQNKFYPNRPLDGQ